MHWNSPVIMHKLGGLVHAPMKLYNILMSNFSVMFKRSLLKYVEESSIP